MSDEHILAIKLHEQACHSNSNECRWEHEITGGIHDWSGEEHKQYLRKAQAIFITTGMDLEDVLRLIEDADA